MSCSALLAAWLEVAWEISIGPSVARSGQDVLPATPATLSAPTCSSVQVAERCALVDTTAAAAARTRHPVGGCGSRRAYNVASRTRCGQGPSACIWEARPLHGRPEFILRGGARTQSSPPEAKMGCSDATLPRGAPCLVLGKGTDSTSALTRASGIFLSVDYKVSCRACASQSAACACFLM